MAEDLLMGVGVSQSLPPNPLDLFRAWWQHAANRPGSLHEAMALATVNADGRPSVRFVLLKAFDESGFVFFTNYQSRKAQDLAGNSFVAATILWDDPRRQVRIEGTAGKLPAAESDAYFATRDRGSQIGAWASPQSRPLDKRQFLDDAAKEVEQRFAGGTIPRPLFWGGYRIIPNAIEFWEGRPNRLHDRFRYEHLDGQEWTTQRLAP